MMLRRRGWLGCGLPGCAAFKPVHLAVNSAIAEWLMGDGRAAVAALNRPLEIDICLDDCNAAVPYIIDKVSAMR